MVANRGRRINGIDWCSLRLVGAERDALRHECPGSAMSLGFVTSLAGCHLCEPLHPPSIHTGRHAMDTSNPVTIQRSDYAPPAFLITHTRLHFALAPDATVVSSTLTLTRQGVGDLVLDGAALILVSVAVDDRRLSESDYTLSETTLTLSALPDACELHIVTRINPDANTALEGLYRSSGNFCTQCEAEGFRKITYYLDRPDVLSIFDVTVEGDKQTCPVLLSNGNLVSTESLGNGRHQVHWHDPHPKPSYLFALVAGDLAHIKESFTTMSGREVELYIYVQAHNLDQCGFAMQSLIHSMRWDETVYGLEYDLERFMIVAVDDFNMGAMENKGLNVFNSRFVLADRETATDSDFIGVESVIAHEYFHNWTGNRITCRDWFQLSLKEGLTVFRDQSFTSDRHSAIVKRIEDVRLLRARQFAEDASPMAHPIRPDSYIEINNFYTLTVYEKGAEVIRMLHTLIGPEAWRSGMDLYVKRHDGTAATCDDFVAAIADASGTDLSQFKRWYSTAGTPELTVSDVWDAEAGTLTLHISQHTPDTSGQNDKPALHIPLKLGLLDRGGAAMPVTVGRVNGDSTVLDVTERSQTFMFDGLSSRPIVSLLRGFSAPVKLKQQSDDDTLAFLMANDTDAFNRWEAGQRLAQRLIEASMDDATVAGDHARAIQRFAEAVGKSLEDESLEPAFRAEVLCLPTLDTLAEDQAVIDIPALQAARQEILLAVVGANQAALESLVDASSDRQDAGGSDDVLSAYAMGKRRLENIALSLLTNFNAERFTPLLAERYSMADNMTDRLAALQALSHGDSSERVVALEDFHQRFVSKRLVIDKWFSVQASAFRTLIVDDVLTLSAHPDFELSNPNRARSLIAVFAIGNPVGFHGRDGRGYRWVADQVLALDKTNPMTAARLVGSLGRWRRFEPVASQLMQLELLRIRDSGPLSKDVFELVSKSLDAA